MHDLQLNDVDLVLVVPPLAHLTWPALGVHLLQAIARERGVRTRVVYLSVLLARRIGALHYAALANAPTDWMLGERLLGWRAWDGLPPERVAEGLPLDDRRVGGGAIEYLDHMTDGTGHVPVAWGDRYVASELVAAARAAGEVVDALADAIVAAGVPMVGATTSFDQTAPAIALLSAIKARDPAIRTLLGGANCEAPMGPAIAALTDAVDHVFCGESDLTFGAFLDDPEGAPRIIEGAPVTDLDAAPGPRFDDYLDQLRAFTPEVLEQGRVWLAYESSRGCWWGEKQHCTFCGLNGVGMAYRAKSPDTVVRDLDALLDGSPTRYVAFTDNILPHAYHKTLLPRLPAEIGDLHAFYEIKANLTLSQVEGLADAGVKVVQPGIEALSTPILRRMRKGVLARQNLALLRYAQACGVLVKWNHLFGFPGDTAEEWAGLPELLGKLHHLSPPAGLVYLSIDRFSPYFEEPETYGITDLRPAQGYARAFPKGADLPALAYHFVGRWTSASQDDPELRRALWDAVEAWRTRWQQGEAPVCQISPQGPGRWLLVDTRSGETIARSLTDPQARAALVGGPWDRVPLADWAVHNDLAVRLDGWCAPVATASREVLSAAEARWAKQGGEAQVVRRMSW